MRPHLIVLVAIVLTPSGSALRAGERVTDARLNFRMSIPDGFVPEPDKVQGTTLYVFRRPPGAGERGGIVIAVSRMGGVMSREPVDMREVVAQNPRASALAEKWKAFDIEVVRAPQEIGGMRTVAFVAQVPLTPEAIQVVVSGEESREEEVRGVLRSVLRDLDGQTNWLDDGQRMRRLGETVGTIVLLLGAGVTAVILVWRSARKRKGAAERLSRPDDGGGQAAT